MTPSAAQPAAAAEPTRRRRFVSNVLWSWAGVALTVLAGFLLSPYIIRKIGDADFGVWTLALSLVEYYWFVDLGLRSAMLKYSAEYRAAGAWDQLDELLSTAFAYSTITGLLLFAVTLLIAPRLGGWLHISHPVFAALVWMTGATWAVGIGFGRFSACLEAFQRFDLTSRIWMTMTLARSIAIFVLLYLGYGLFAMGLALTAGQLLFFGMTWLALRRVLPGSHVRLRLATVPMFRRMTGYGIHSMTVLVATRILNNSVPFLIAWFLPIRYVTYFALPARLLDYSHEAIGRVGMVTAPSATELQVKGTSEDLVRVGVLTNRYCLTIYLPVTVLLGVYGLELIRVWIRADFPVESVWVLWILLAGMTAMAGQANSVSVLFGIARHQGYARALLAEAVVSAAGVALALPRYGVIGAAVVKSALTVVNRGGVCAWLFSRELKTSLARYVAAIYAAPMAVGAAAAAALWWVKHAWLPGRNWLELAAAAAFFALLYTPLAFRFCVAPQHRDLLLARLRIR